MRLDAPLRAVLGLAGLVVVVAGLRSAGDFFLPLLTAVFIATVTAPVVAFFERRARFPWPLAVLLTIVLDMTVLGGFIALVGTSLSGLHQALPRYQAALAIRTQNLVDRLEIWGFRLSATAISELGDARAMNVVADVLSELAEALSNIVLVLLLVGFLLFETRSAREKLAVLLGYTSPHVASVARAAGEVQRYLVVKTVLSVLTGVLSGCWMGVCGLDAPVLWGLFTFLLSYIPSIGPAISLVPPLVIALLTLGPGGAAAVAVGHLGIGFVIGNVLEPRMIGKTLGLSPLAVFLSMFFWGWLWGPIGALYAVPLTMLLRTLAESFPETRWLAILLGSTRYVVEKQREWGWPTSAGHLSAPLRPPSSARFSGSESMTSHHEAPRADLEASGERPTGTTKPSQCDATQ
jgi:predicted PurR-regulated permease PerM